MLPSQCLCDGNSQHEWNEGWKERRREEKDKNPLALYGTHFHSSPENASIQLFLLIFFFVLSLHERKGRNKSAKRNNGKILSPSISYLSINMSSLFLYQNINQLPLLQILFFSLFPSIFLSLHLPHSLYNCGSFLSYNNFILFHLHPSQELKGERRKKNNTTGNDGPRLACLSSREHREKRVLENTERREL